MAPTLKEWLLAPVCKSDGLADYLARRCVSYRYRPPLDFDERDDSGGVEAGWPDESQSG